MALEHIAGCVAKSIADYGEDGYGVGRRSADMPVVDYWFSQMDLDALTRELESVPSKPVDRATVAVGAGKTRRCSSKACKAQLHGEAVRTSRVDVAHFTKPFLWKETGVRFWCVGCAPAARVVV